jgi:secondary thiamine-phosphate synthase enzyme
MRQDKQNFSISTKGAGLYEFTREVEDFVATSAVEAGLLTLFCRHTSCSLLIQENADRDVRTDLLTFFKRLAPEGLDFIIHDAEGPDDMPAHIKAALTQTSLSIPIAGGVPMLGTWQGIYLFEHRSAPHRRNIIGHIIGE